MLTKFHHIYNFLSVRPVVFTVGFSGVSIAGCALWDYEEQKKGALRTRLRSFGFGVGEAK